MSGKKFDIQHLPFMGLILLIAGFSLYGVMSSSISLGNYTNSVKASVIAIEPVTDTSVSPKLIFSDVPATHENATAIAYFKQMGYVGGYDDGSFKPANLVNRAEFLKMLLEVVDADFASGVYEKCFKDVKSEWYAVYACYASQKKWVNGFDDGTFRPVQTVTRVEAIKMAFIALGVKVPATVDGKPYTDVNVGDWFAPYAKAAKDAGIVKGQAFLPELKLTRAATIQELYDILEYSGKVVREV